MTNELPERSPIELQADDCGALITISRQWYEEAISALRAQEKEPNIGRKYALTTGLCPICKEEGKNA